MLTAGISSPRSNNEAGTLQLIALALFVPGHLFGWALEWIWLATQLIAGGIAMMFVRQSYQATAGVPAMVWAFALTALTFTGCLSAVYGHTIVGIPFDNGDIVDLVRFIFFIPLALHIGASLEDRHLDAVVKLMKLCILLNIGCSIILVLELPILFDGVLAIYREAKVQYAFNHIRIGIPFANPNFAALIFTLMLAYFLFFGRSIRYAGFAILAIILTGSRSGYIAATPLLLLAYFEFLFRSATDGKRAALLFAIHGAAFFAASSLADTFGGFSRVSELVTALQGGDLGQVNTANIRFELIDNALKFIQASPVFGVGPGRALGLDVVDSQLVSWPLNYGIPAALLLYSLFIAPMAILAVKALQPIHRFAAIATLLAFFLMLGTGDFMKNYRLFYLVLVLMHLMHLAAMRTPPHNSTALPSSIS